MKIRNFILTGAAMLLASPIFASTYYVGFEDLSATKGSTSDFDYNDLVFSLSGANLTLKTTDGKWYSNPTINQNGDPFWDKVSWDGDKKNIGYCIYGGGNCGTALAPGSQFLADKTGTNKTADDVYFSNSGSVAATVYLSITSAKDTLYWYKTSGGPLNQINTTPGTYAFNPMGDFGLAAYNANTKMLYYSQLSRCDDPNDPAHFAFFQPTPEPGTMGAMAGGLILLGSIYRRRKASEQK